MVGGRTSGTVRSCGIRLLINLWSSHPAARLGFPQAVACVRCLPSAGGRPLDRGSHGHGRTVLPAGAGSSLFSVGLASGFLVLVVLAVCCLLEQRSNAVRRRVALLPFGAGSPPLFVVLVGGSLRCLGLLAFVRRPSGLQQRALRSCCLALRTCRAGRLLAGFRCCAALSVSVPCFSGASCVVLTGGGRVLWRACRGCGFCGFVWALSVCP